MRFSCKTKANATKSFRIAKVPPILTFHLKRFAVNFTSSGRPRNTKFNQFIDYPEFLDVAPYMVDPKVSPASTLRRAQADKLSRPEEPNIDSSASPVIEAQNCVSVITPPTSRHLLADGTTPTTQI